MVRRGSAGAMPSRDMLTTGWARAYAIVKRQGTVEELRAVYEAAPMSDVNYGLSKQEAGADDDFERFMIGASLIHMIACQVRFNHIDRTQAHAYIGALVEMGLDRGQLNDDGQSALDLDAYWKPEENVSDLLDAKRELPTTKIETILDAGRQRSRAWRRAAAATARSS